MALTLSTPTERIAAPRLLLRRFAPSGDPQSRIAPSRIHVLKEGLSLLGSAEETDIRLEVPGLPDIALQLEKAGFEIRAEAVDARSLIRLNGREFSAGILRPGDRLEIGTAGSEIGSAVFILDVEDPLSASSSGTSKVPAQSLSPSSMSPLPASGPSANFGPALTPSLLDRLQEVAKLAADTVGKRSGPKAAGKADGRGEGKDPDGSGVTSLLQGLLRILLDALKGTEAFLFVLDAEGKPRIAESRMAESPAGGNKAAAAGASKPLLPPSELFSDSVVQEVLKTGRGLALPHALSDARFAANKSIVDLQLGTVLCAPIRLGGRMLGLIYIGCRKGLLSYGEADLEALSFYALLCGMLIDSVEYISRQAESIRRLAAGAETAEGDTGLESGLLGQSRPLRALREKLLTLAPSDIAVLLHGETGTGKEVAARHLHAKSLRGKGPFIALNCSALRGELLESELFGYRKGAFTGALSDRKGLFQAADAGTLFLDEIGEMDLNLQAKLLRALETGRVRPVGAVGEEKADVRILAATHRKLEEKVADGSFREDLFYRIAQVTVALPPLRERGEDILLLAYHYLERFREKYPQKEIRDFHPDSLGALLSHEWPGNVRELVNVIHRSVLTSPGPLLVLDPHSFKAGFLSLEAATRHFQATYLRRALALTGNDKEAAAKMLDMSRSTFFRYLAGLEVT